MTLPLVVVGVVSQAVGAGGGVVAVVVVVVGVVIAVH